MSNEDSKPCMVYMFGKNIPHKKRVEHILLHLSKTGKTDPSLLPISSLIAYFAILSGNKGRGAGLLLLPSMTIK